MTHPPGLGDSDEERNTHAVPQDGEHLEDEDDDEVENLTGTQVERSSRTIPLVLNCPTVEA